MKLIAAVITYYPDTEDATRNVHQYLPYIDKLIIWINTPVADAEKYQLHLPPQEEKILYMGTDKNEGIGYALNRVVEYSIQNGYTHLLTMDQDSYFVDFKTYLSTIKKYAEEPDIAIFSPNINLKITSAKEIEYVPEAITSGSIYTLNLLADGIRFREDFFIDMVDNEFCYRINRKGFHTVAIIQSELQQKFGNRTRCMPGVYSTNYSAFRIYHLIRNFIITWKEYPDLIVNKQVFIPKIILGNAVKIVLFEKDKVRKLQAICLGIHDGLRNKMINRNFQNR